MSDLSQLNLAIRPLGDRVLLARQKPADRTPGGLHLPDASKEKPDHGVIVAVGKGGRDHTGHVVTPPDVKVGDRVLFQRFAGSPVRLDGLDPALELLLLREADLMAVLATPPPAPDPAERLASNDQADALAAAVATM